MAITSTSIKPGQVNNPNGRPVSEASRLRSEMRDAFCLKTFPKFDEFIEEIHKLALSKGQDQINAIRIILDYCLGRPIAQKEEDDNTGSQLNIFAFKRIEELEAKLLALENSKSHD